MLESSGDYDFTLDAESQEARLRVEHAVGSQWAAMIELPWRNLSGGSLDGFIENWHDLFGLPQGPRKNMPDDRLLIDYQRDGETLLHLDDGGSGIADIPIGVGYQAHASEERAVSAWLTVKLPVGDSDDLLGSGATDVALSIAGETRLAEQWLLFGQVDAVWLGDGEILPQSQDSFAWAALAGVSWNAWRTLDLTVQFQANSQVFDLPVEGLSGDRSDPELWRQLPHDRRLALRCRDERGHPGGRFARRHVLFRRAARILTGTLRDGLHAAEDER